MIEVKIMKDAIYHLLQLAELRFESKNKLVSKESLILQTLGEFAVSQTYETSFNTNPNYYCEPVLINGYSTLVHTSVIESDLVLPETYSADCEIILLVLKSKTPRTLDIVGFISPAKVKLCAQVQPSGILKVSRDKLTPAEKLCRRFNAQVIQK